MLGEIAAPSDSAHGSRLVTIGVKRDRDHVTVVNGNALNGVGEVTEMRDGSGCGRAGGARGDGQASGRS